MNWASILSGVFLVFAIIFFLAFAGTEDGSEDENNMFTCCCTSSILFLVFAGVDAKKDEEEVIVNNPSENNFSTYSLGFFSKLRIYRDRIEIDNFLSSTISINARQISSIARGGFFEAAVKITESSGKVHELNPTSPDTVVNEIQNLMNVNETVVEKNIYQHIVQGDQITKTEVKDSVLNRSNIGESNSKMQELEKLAEMKEKGLIDDDEFKQMKKEILSK